MINFLKNALENDDFCEEFVEAVCDDFYCEINYQGVTFKGVKQKGGEGQGDHYYIVFSAEKDGVKTYFKIDGYYSSYNGVDIDPMNFYEVEPFKKVVLDWKKK